MSGYWSFWGSTASEEATSEWYYEKWPWEYDVCGLIHLGDSPVEWK
jgi:hypothetical protein